MTDLRDDPLTDAGLVPVITMDRVDDAGLLAAALVEGGIPYAEVTFRTPAAPRVIDRMRSESPQMMVGAGTVLTVEQADRAVRAGAQYLVSPAFDTAVVSWGEERSVPIIPGVATATEVNTAWQRGLRTLKLFPVEQLGGVGLLQALRGPFPDIEFVPTGGITPHNLANYARQPNVVACGGSWIASREALSGRKFDDILAAAQEASKILRRAREQRSEAR